MIVFFLKDGTVQVTSSYDDSPNFILRQEVEKVWVDGWDLEGYGSVWSVDSGGIVKFGPEERYSVDELFGAKFHYPENRLNRFGDSYIHPSSKAEPSGKM